MSESVLKYVGRAAIVQLPVESRQEFRSLVRTWASVTRAVLRHRSFKRGVLMGLLCLVGVIASYDMYTWRLASSAGNSFFRHQQWVPGITLSWGWENTPESLSSYQIQNCLSQGSDLIVSTMPTCDSNSFFDPSDSYHGFPFSVSDGGSYNPVAQELNGVTEALSGTAVLAGLWYGFWRREGRSA